MIENKNVNIDRERKLTTYLAGYAKKRSRSGISSSFLLPILWFTCLSMAIFDIMLLTELIFGIFKGMPKGFVIFTIISNIPASFLVIYIIRKKKVLYRKYCFVLLNGVITDAKIRDITLEWNVQINDTPRSIVDIDVDGRIVRIKTYDPEILNYVSTGSTVPIIWHADMPEIIIPVESLKQKTEAREPDTFVV